LGRRKKLRKRDSGGGTGCNRRAHLNREGKLQNDPKKGGWEHEKKTKEQEKGSKIIYLRPGDSKKKITEESSGKNQETEREKYGEKGKEDFPDSIFCPST